MMRPILMYHGLHAQVSDRGRYDSVYSVRPEDFARQLDWLVQNEWRSMRLDQWDSDPGADTSERQVVISFDDGDISNLETALPLLLERAMVAEFFITSDFVGQAGMLAEPDIRTLADAGMGVQSHGQTHRFLEDLDSDAMIDELTESARRLQALSGTPVTAIALPGGRGGERERLAALRLGYRQLLGSVPGCNRRWSTGRWLERIAVTRELALNRFAALVEYRGLAPRMARLRYDGLALPKRILGNARYASLRTRMLKQ